MAPIDPMKISRLSRRGVLGGALAGLCLWDAPLHYALAALPGDRRLVVVILRGAVDGLAMVPPHGDKDYAATRGALALSTDGATPLHDLDGMFGLHPALLDSVLHARGPGQPFAAPR